MSHASPLTRQWILLRLLSARHFGATVQALAVEMQVNEKTIRRDLAAFVTAGFPLDETVLKHGCKAWKIKSDGPHPEMSFAFDEALSLYLGRRFLEPLAGTLLWEAAQRAFKKIRACLGKTALDYLEKMAGNLHHTAIGASDYSQKAQLLDDLMLAIEDRRATLIGYQSARATESVTYDVHPYGLTYHRGSLYMVAFSRDHDTVRHFKLDRIDDVRLTEFPFHKPDDFDLAHHMAGSFGVFHGDGDVTVKVRFVPVVARYVQESKWHASQQLSKQKDGSLLAEFHLSATDEIKHWVLSFGNQAEIIEPESLRQEVIAELQGLLRRYGDKPAPSDSSQTAQSLKTSEKKTSKEFVSE